MTDAMKERYWIAINGASCARTSFPLRKPFVTPTPFQLIGFPTFKESVEAQRILLHEPIETGFQFCESLMPRVRNGEIVVIQPAHPQPPTTGPTMWTESEDLYGVVQRVMQPDDVN